MASVTVGAPGREAVHADEARNHLRPLFDAERFGPDRSRDAFHVGLPTGWRTLASSPWTYHEPAGVILPEQGWKIHISTTALVASQALTLVSDVCIEHGVAFKHLTSFGELHTANAKYADRGSAGKFITIYPATIEAFDLLLSALDRRLAGLPGPYILSDVRIGTGPVFARYGAFEEMRAAGDAGEEILCVRRPDGTLEEDRREPVLHVPDYVDVPSSISEYVAERLNPSDSGLSGLLGDLQAESALHFSNGGGVYRLQSASGDEYFVMKEGRRHAAWDFRGVDAFDRVLYEHANLKILESTGATPRPAALKIVEDHAFLIEEHIAGRSLYSWVAAEYPFSYSYRPEDYEPRALEVFKKLTSAVDAVHARGMAVMDLHPFNVIVTAEGTVKLIDLESCCPLAASDAPAFVGTPGYMPKGPHTPRERDDYAMLQLAIALFYPVASVASISDDVIRVLCAHIESLFSKNVTALIQNLFGSVRHLMVPGLSAGLHMDEGRPEELPELVENLSEGIRLLRDETATRLPYPLSGVMPGSFAELSIESGLSGIMLALGERDRNADEDLRVLRDAATTARIVSAGLLSGATGVALVLASRGEQEAAHELFHRRRPLAVPQNISLRNGVAGELTGSLLLLRYTNDKRTASVAGEWLDELTQLVAEPPAQLSSAGSSTSIALGLIHGWSGAATALCLAARTLDRPDLFSVARSAIELDLPNMIRAPDGSLQADDGDRMMPYVGDGSAGLGLALSAIPPAYRRPGDDEILRDVRLACRARVCVSAGLLHGRMGLLLTMAVLGDQLGIESQDMLREELPLLRPFLFGAGAQKAIVVPAEDNRRLSLDLSQGAAGWIVALKTVEALAAHDPSVSPLRHFLGMPVG